MTLNLPILKLILLKISEVSAPKGFKLDKAVSVRYHFDHNEDIFVMDAKSIGNLGRYFNVSLQLNFCLLRKLICSISSALLWTERDRSKCLRRHSWPPFPVGGFFHQKVCASRHGALLGLQLWNWQSSWSTTWLLLWNWYLPRAPFIISCFAFGSFFYFKLHFFVMSGNFYLSELSICL